MRTRTRRILCTGLALAASGTLAAGAMASDRGSSKGPSAMKLEAKGSVSAFTAATATTAGSVTVSAGGTDWTCAVPAGSMATATVGARTELKCRDINGVLTATKVKSRNSSGHEGEHKSTNDRGSSSSSTGKVEVEARGTVTAIGVDATGVPTSITVDPGLTGRTDTLPALTCAVSDRTEVRGNPAVGDTVKIECHTRKGVLTADEIKAKSATSTPSTSPSGSDDDHSSPMPNSLKVEAKGLITALAADSITVGTVTCSIPTGVSTTGFAVGDKVEIHCSGTPLALDKIERED